MMILKTTPGWHSFVIDPDWRLAVSDAMPAPKDSLRVPCFFDFQQPRVGFSVP